MVIVQLLSRVQLFVTPWTTAFSASLRRSCPSLSPRVFSNSCPLSQWWYLIMSSSAALFSFCLLSFPILGLLQWVDSSHHVANILELQHQSFQWTFKFDFHSIDCVWSSHSPRDSHESSPAPCFESINSSALSLLYGLTLKAVHDYWKSHSFDYIDLCQQSDVWF